MKKKVTKIKRDWITYPKSARAFSNSSSSSLDSGTSNPKVIPCDILQNILDEHLEEQFECIVCLEMKDDQDPNDQTKVTCQLNCCFHYLCGSCYRNLENQNFALGGGGFPENAPFMKSRLLHLMFLTIFVIIVIISMKNLFF